MELYLDEISELLKRPKDAFPRILQNPTFEHAIHVPLILASIGFISGYIVFMKIGVHATVKPSLAVQMFLFLSRYKLIVLPAIYPLLLCFVVAMVIHTIAELPCGAESTYEEAVTMVGFSMVPLALSSFLKLIATALMPKTYLSVNVSNIMIGSKQLTSGISRFFDAQPFVISGGLEVLMMVWTFYLMYIGIGKQYNLKSLAALCTLLGGILIWIVMGNLYSLWQV